MRSFYAIYRKEMGHYFVSPIAYVVIAAFILVSAIVFLANLDGAITRLAAQAANARHAVRNALQF